MFIHLITGPVISKSVPVCVGNECAREKVELSNVKRSGDR